MCKTCAKIRVRENWKSDIWKDLQYPEILKVAEKIERRIWDDKIPWVRDAGGEKGI